MNRPLLIATLLLGLGAAAAQAEDIQLIANGSTPSAPGPQAFFSGHAVIDPLYPATAATGATTGLVTFAPGARTAWHSHPAGQLLIVTQGQGWVQQDAKPRQTLNPGDVVWIPADVKHWHGATDRNGMSHIAVSYMKDGQNVTWLEPVSDDQYRG